MVNAAEMRANIVARLATARAKAKQLKAEEDAKAKLAAIRARILARTPKSARRALTVVVPPKTSETKREDKDVFIGPKKEEKLSPIQSRAMALRAIGQSTTLSKEEKVIRIRQVLTGMPRGMTRTEIETISEPRQISYSDVRSSIETSRTNIERSIIDLSSPTTYYDPVRDVIVEDPTLARDPLFLVVTSAKIKELETTKSELDVSEESLKRAEQYKFEIIATGEGGFSFEPTEESKKIFEKEVISEKKEELRSLYTGTGVERVAGLAHFVTTGLLSFEDPLGFTSGLKAVTGDPEGALETKARASIDLDKAIKEGLGSYVLKVSTGPVATVGAAFVGGGAIKAGAQYATGYLGAKGIASAPLLVKGVQTGVGIGVGAFAAKDVVETFQTEGPIEGTTKGLFYGVLLGAGIAGYKSVGGEKFFAKGGARFFKSHPDAPKITFGVKGELIGTKTKISGFTSRGTPLQETRISIGEVSAHKPQALPVKPSFFEAWSSEKQLGYYEAVRAGVGKKQMFIRFPGSKETFFGSKFKAVGFDIGKTRGARFFDTGKTIKVTTPEGQVTEFAVPESQLLTHGKSLRFWTYKTPPIGERILVFKHLSFKDVKGMTLKEITGGGGIGQQLEPQILTKSVFPRTEVPFFPSTGVGSLGVVIPPVFVPPTPTTIVKPISEQVQPTDIVFEPGIDVERRPVHGVIREPVYDFVLGEDVVDIQRTGKIQRIDFDYAPPPPEQILETVFDVPSDVKEYPPEDVFFRRTGGGFPGFPRLPRGLGGAGGTDMGFGFTTPITRGRKYKLGNILEEFEKGFKF